MKTYGAKSSSRNILVLRRGEMLPILIAILVQAVVRVFRGHPGSAASSGGSAGPFSPAVETIINYVCAALVIFAIICWLLRVSRMMLSGK